MYFFQFLVIKPLDSELDPDLDPDPQLGKMLDLDPHWIHNPVQDIWFRFGSGFSYPQAKLQLLNYRMLKKVVHFFKIGIKRKG